MDKQIIIEEIRKCKLKAEIIKIFTENNIDTSHEKIDILNQVMYNPEKFYSSGSINEEEELELELDIFEIGDWRLAELYKKLRS